MKDCDYILHYNSFKFMQVNCIGSRLLTRVIEFLSQTRSYFLYLRHDFFLIYYLYGSSSTESLVLKEEGMGEVGMYRLSLEHSRYLISSALFLHSFTKMVIRCSLVQLYVSAQLLLAPHIWSGYMEPDARLICPIGAVGVLSDFRQVHITWSKKWHTVQFNSILFHPFDNSLYRIHQYFYFILKSICEFSHVSYIKCIYPYIYKIVNRFRFFTVILQNAYPICQIYITYFYTNNILLLNKRTAAVKTNSASF
jgi:hypothetical protein